MATKSKPYLFGKAFSHPKVRHCLGKTQFTLLRNPYSFIFLYLVNSFYDYVTICVNLIKVKLNYELA